MSQQQSFALSVLPIIDNIEFIRGDDSVAVPPNPSTHVLELVTTSSDEDNANGIASSGNAGTYTETISLTNRIIGSATTTDNTTPQVLFSFPMSATPGTYLFRNFIVAFNTTTSKSAIYEFTEGVRTTGAAGILLITGNQLVSEEGTMSGVNVNTSCSTNSYIVTATGLAGETINYSSLTEYSFIG